MKKIILILVVILVGVWVVLSALGSGGEYAAEKVFYHAMKINEKILLNPEVVPPKMFTSVESDLLKIMKKYPKGNMAKTARITLAEFYLNNKKYDKVLSTIDSMMTAYKDDPLVLSQAQFLKGLAYEKQNKWERALKEYMILRDKYTDTPLGIEIPIYIGKRYIQKGDKAQAEKAYNDAAVFYERIEKQYTQKPLGYVAASLLTQTYMYLGKYEQAGAVVINTINNYPGNQTLMQQLPYVELIYARLLKSPQRAIEVYKNIIEQSKDSKLKNFLKGRIKELETKK